MRTYFRKGQSLPLISIMLLLFIIILGVVVDTGRYVIIQQQTQWLADAAALASVTKASQMTTENILNAETLDSTLAAETNKYIQLNNTSKLSGSSNLYITVTNSIDAAVTLPVVIVQATIAVPFKYQYSGILHAKDVRITKKATAQYDPGLVPTIELTK